MSHVINRQAPERLLLFVVLETTKFDSTEFRFPREAEAKYSNVLALTFFLLTASVVQIQKTKTDSMNSSSPAHSSISTTAVVGGGGGGVSNAAVSLDDFHFPFDPISTEERKDEAMLVLKSDLMAALDKEVKSLDEDNWKFEGPRSRIHLVSRRGGHLHRPTEISKIWNLTPPK